MITQEKRRANELASEKAADSLRVRDLLQTLDHMKSYTARMHDYVETGTNIRLELISLGNMLFSAMAQNEDIWMHRTYHQDRHLREAQRELG